MAKLSFILNPKKANKDGSTRTVVVRIGMNSKSRYYSTSFKAKPHQWNDKGQQFKGSHQYLNPDLLEYKNRVTKIFHRLLEQETLTFDRFKNELKGSSSEKPTVQSYIEGLILEMKAEDKIGNALIYKELLSLLKRYHSRALAFEDINITFLKSLETRMRKQGVSGNSRSKQFRTLRATFNRATGDRLVSVNAYPFKNPMNPRGFNISALETTTEKRALAEADLQKILDYEPQSERQDLARSVFVISLYLQGISFGDLSKLKYDNIQDGRVIYNRQKTRNKARISIKITQPVQEIIDKYRDNTSPYLLPILSSFHKSEQQKFNRIHKKIVQVNKGLKEIASNAGIEGNVTTYVARHSFATILKQKGISTAIIQEAMGHTSEKTTQIYLDSFGNEAVDNANKALP